MKITKSLNGINMTIDFPVEDLIRTINDNREDWMDTFTEIIHIYDEKASEEYQKKTIDEMIEKISYYQHHTDELFDMLPLKKNNKLSKSGKPTLYCLEIGSYWEESYGWHTYEIKMKALDELNAEIYLNDTIVHY